MATVSEEIAVLRGTRPATFRGLLRDPGFSRLYRAILVSSLGDWVGFVAVVALVGFYAALILFFLAFLRTIARTSSVATLLLTAGACVSILILAYFLNLDFPGGVLQDYVRLPWPFR